MAVIPLSVALASSFLKVNLQVIFWGLEVGVGYVFEDWPVFSVDVHEVTGLFEEKQNISFFLPLCII